MGRRKLLALLLLAAAPLSADWLVTREGARVETRGPWKVKGKLVVFTGAGGDLASLRLAEVDLPASERATAEAQAPASPPEPPPAAEAPKKPAAVVTNETLDRAKPQETEPAAAAPASAATPEPEPSSGPAVIGAWKRAERAGGGVEIVGTVENRGGDIAADAAVTVRLYDEAGGLLATSSALLTSTSIKPRGAVEFRAAFPEVFAFAQARFQVKSWPLDLSPLPEGKTAPPP
jgi:hypothetical protein